MWIELHIGPNDPKPVTVNTDKLQDFQPVTKNLDYQTHLWFSQDEGYVVEEGYNVVKRLVRGGFYVDTTGERLRAREEFFRKSNECFNIRTGNRDTDLQGQAVSTGLDE